VLIAVCLTALLGATDPPATAVEAKEQKAKTETETQDPDQPKKAKKPKKDQKAKKKNAVADDELAPDEPIEPDADKAGTGWSFSWNQHPSVRYGDWLRIDGEGKMQEDGHSAYGPVQGLSTWEFHRNRFGIKGYVTKHIEYEVEHEFTEKELTEKDVEAGITPKSQWKDVYLNLTYFKKGQIQLGKFKVPFGLDELTGVTHNDYIYRSLSANYLDPGRDIGAMVHASFFKHGLTYAVGVFDHDGDNAKSKKIEGGGHTVAGRATLVPFRKATTSSWGNIELGSAYAFSALSDDSFRPNGLRGRTIMTQDDFYSSVYVKGNRRRWEADVDWTTGPASLRAEYT